MKRYFVPGFFDFDTRAMTLNTEISESWEADVKELHRGNRERLLTSLRREFGEQDFDAKLENFKNVGAQPFSIVSYHNVFFRQVRAAYVFGAYFPALTAACSLGERILNHLVLDLRDFYKNTPEYKRAHRKESFDNWEVAIKALEAWEVIQADVPDLFRKLSNIRNRSIHYNKTTYVTVKDDALEALKTLSAIITEQFGAFGTHRWLIKGTSGACFIKKGYESDPFIKTFYLPQCPLVGPYYAVDFAEQGILFFDKKNYEEKEISDDEFCLLFNNRSADSVVSSKVPPDSDVIIYLLSTTRSVS